MACLVLEFCQLYAQARQPTPLALRRMLSLPSLQTFAVGGFAWFAPAMIYHYKVCELGGERRLGTLLLSRHQARALLAQRFLSGQIVLPQSHAGATIA